MRNVLNLCFGLSFALGYVRAATSPAPARPFLCPLFGDHMVVQRGKPCVLWGWAAAGTKVRARLGDASATGTAAADGRWQVSLPSPAAGGPYSLVLTGPQQVTLTDVMVGDVWICSGQSNMELPLKVTDGAAQAVRQADLPRLRFFSVHPHVAYQPGDQVDGQWRPSSPASAPDFSAVAYYFGRKLLQSTDIPIGLIQDCLGGSPAEAWMSSRSLDGLAEFQPQLAAIAALRARGGPEYGSFLMHWLDQYDRGGRDNRWAQSGFDDHTWQSVQISSGFRELGVPTDPAIVWFRRELQLTAEDLRHPAQIALGEIERMDTVYLNGRRIGASSWVENPRLYAVPAGTLVVGRNVVALRVFKTKPNGGVRSPAETLSLNFEGGRRVSLAGAWQAALSFDARPPQPLPLDFDNYPTMPTVLYNGMMAPVAPLSIAGAIWYQGEANTGRPAAQYRKLLPALIADWRRSFGQGDFPFYIVSLPAFMARKTEPGTDGWAELRAVQAETARSVKHSGLAVTIDTGNPANIHPTNKQPVGERLALCALAEYYHRPVEAEGPQLAAVVARPGGLALRFSHTGTGLVVRGAQLGEFSVAGADGQWHWAAARLTGPAVVEVSSPEVAQPKFVRYAWQGNPLATLFGSTGLPAEPFGSNAVERDLRGALDR